MGDSNTPANGEELHAGEFVVQVFEHAVRVQPWSDGYAVARLGDLRAFGLDREELEKCQRGGRRGVSLIGLDDLSDAIDRRLQEGQSDSRLLRAHGLLSNLIEQAHADSRGTLRKRPPRPQVADRNDTEVVLLMVSVKGDQLDVVVHPLLENIAQAELEQLLVPIVSRLMVVRAVTACTD